MTRGAGVPSGQASTSAVTTSWYSGSPMAPGSLVRSSTAIERTVFGSALTKACVSNGRYRRTVSKPTFSPAATSLVTASREAPTPEPICTSTRSASGAPLYQNRL